MPPHREISETFNRSKDGLQDMTEQLLITPPPCVLTPFPLPIPARPRHEPLHNDVLWWIPGKAANPPRRLLGLICRLPAGLVSPNSGNSSTEAQKKKLQKNKPKQKTGSQFNLVAQESAAETRTCLVRLFGGSPVQIFKAVGVSQFAQAMSERTHIQHRRARGWFFLKQKKWKPFNETDSF